LIHGGGGGGMGKDGGEDGEISGGVGGGGITESFVLSNSLHFLVRPS